ncbi:MAG: putative manganese-dependent inorganic diphosphatase [Clostridia bacterium]|nr:putative manganese-dependent inorganic diphosphatase [Clostridia bacterium]
MRENIYITGHKNPDSDSIISAIAYATLKNALGQREYKAARIGTVSDQTQLLLDKFGFEAPYLLHNVRTQVRDLNYDKPPILSSAVTIHKAWEILEKDASAQMGLPITDEDGRLFGMLTSGDIASYEMRFVENNRVEKIPLFNLLANLDGQLFLDNGSAERITGELIIALPGAEAEFNSESIVLLGAQPEVFRAALNKRVRAVIVCEADIDRTVLADFAETETTIVSTPYDAYRASRLIIQALPVSCICNREQLVSFHLTDYLDDVREATLKTRYRSYPILDEQDRVVGTLSRFHLLRPNKKRVVLVDHNEVAQSVPGLEQADILEIIDHHRLADVQTGAPIYMRNEPVGSTCTIVTGMFQENGIMPSKKLAGLLAAGIVSDTVMFKSPTCTQRDRVLAERMARHAGVSLEDLAKEMFAVSIAAHDPRETLFSDFKRFQIAGHSIGIGQITCIDSGEVEKDKDRFLEIMHKEKREKGYDMLLLMITDILRAGSLLLYSGDTETVEQAFNVKTDNNSAFLEGIISRKKQVVPALSVLWG